MPVRTEKNIFAPVDDGDGMRLLITRYWPRGVAKKKVSLYLPDLAPSRELLHEIHDEVITWRDFTARYRAEMKGQKSLIRLLKHMADHGETLTLLCTCDSEDRCHRYLLGELIAKSD
jgi:uncharacterized protein YeaO (DUF488 family)